MPDHRIDHLIVTGGTGYIGSRLVDLACAQGRQVTVLGRRPASTVSRHVQWSLGDRFPEDALHPDLPPERQAIIHLAHAWDGDEHQDVEATQILFTDARKAGVGERIFISSQSAREACPNRYGRMKWRIEQLLEGDTSLRVGLVYGGPRTAMYGLLCRISSLPVLPMVDPHRTVQPIHLDEVVQGILAAADKHMTGVFALAGPIPILFSDVLRSLARAYHGRRLVIVPVPLKLALIGCDLSALVPFVPTIDRERVLGLVGTEPIAAAEDLEKLGLAVQPLEERLAREPAGVRALLAEGRAFVCYAIGGSPSPSSLARYVKSFPEGAIPRPRFLMRCREPLTSDNVLSRRLRIASRIAEASKPGEKVLSTGSRAARLSRIAAALLIELFALPPRLIATCFARGYGR